MAEETVRCWLVERTLDDRNLVRLVYATRDGSRFQRRERSGTALRAGSPVTAAVEVDVEALESVRDEETRERYAAAAERTAERYDPDEAI